MSAVVHDDDYERLIKRFPLRPIRSEEENERAFEICDELTDRLDELSMGERDYLDVLSTLIAKFESRWEDDVAHMTPREVVEFLMEQNDLAQKDLIPEFGTSSRVSEFLKGHRGLSLEQARRLSERFKLNVSLFIEKAVPKEPSQTMRLWRVIFNERTEVSYRDFFEVFARSLQQYESDWEKILSEEADGNLCDITPKLFAAFKGWMAERQPEEAALWYRPRLTSESFLSMDSREQCYSPEPLGVSSQSSSHGFSFFNFLKKHDEPKSPSYHTYRDAVRTLFKLAECDFERHPQFWERHINLTKGDKVIDEFANELAKELSQW